MRTVSPGSRASSTDVDWRTTPYVAYTYPYMDTERLPLDFGNLPLGSLYEERLVEDLLLLVDVVRACRDGDDAKLTELGVGTVPQS